MALGRARPGHPRLRPRRAPVMWILVRPRLSTEFRCRSAADPVPAPQNARDFRCRPARL